jgi:hypothetical protein
MEKEQLNTKKEIHTKEIGLIIVNMDKEFIIKKFMQMIKRNLTNIQDNLKKDLIVEKVLWNIITGINMMVNG